MISTPAKTTATLISEWLLWSALLPFVHCRCPAADGQVLPFANGRYQGARRGINGKGLMITDDVSNILVRNLSIADINGAIVWGGEAITIDNASEIWLDHNYIARIGRR